MIHTSKGKNIITCLVLLFTICCKIQPGSDKKNPDSNSIYKLQLHPDIGSKYSYAITNESKTKIETDGKKIELKKKYDVEIHYEISKDSAGLFLINMGYDKIHIYTKNGDTESELDASNSANTTDPVEKMLGALKAANISAIVNAAGDIKAINGYQGIANDFLSAIKTNNISEKTKAQMQWKHLIEDEFVKKNMDQLFKIFPDSALHTGDKWKIFSTEKNDINIRIKNFYKLKAIHDGIADIESEGEIVADSTTSNLMGYDVTSDIKGEQTGVYLMDIKTGMLNQCNIKSQLEGSIQMLGRDIPVFIETLVKIEGKKIK
jgi:uncharacterized protein DUF6263